MEKWGELLVNNKSYSQAILYLEKAIDTAPSKVYYARGDALASYIFCLIKLGKLDQAKELLETQALPQDKDSIQNYYDLALIYRLYAEINCIKGDYRKALEHLTLAYNKHQGYTFTIYWLTGLAHYKLGNTKESNEWFENSKRHYSDPKHYSETESLTFFNGEDRSVDWETKSIATTTLKPRDQDYWSNFFLKHNQIDKIPEEYITQEMINRIYSEGSEVYGASDIRIDRYTFNHIPTKYITREIVLRAFNFTITDEQFLKIPPFYLDKEFFLKAKEYKLKHVPEDIADYDLYLDSVAKDFYNLQDIPQLFRDDKIITMAISRGAIESLPKKFQTTDYIKKAISISFTALQRIPNRFIGMEVYEHAKSLYSNHPDWETIDSKHRFDGDFTQDSIDKTWAYNWTEEFILEVIRRHRYIVQLPAEYFTPKIALLEVKTNTDHINWLPKPLITQELCTLACKNFQNIGKIPTKFRNQQLLDNISYSKKAECEYWLTQLPIELRTEDNCYVYLGFGLNMEPVPYEHYIPLMNRFLTLSKKARKQYDYSYYYYRGIGHLHQKNIEAALEDFLLSEQSINKDNPDSDYLGHIFYYRGYIHRLQNKNDAADLYQKSQSIYEKLSTHDYNRLTTPYEKFRFSKIHTDVSDWDAFELNEQLQQIYKILDFGFFDEAMREIADIEENLRNNSNEYPVDWVRLWSFKLEWLFYFGKIDEATQLHNETLKKIDPKRLDKNIKDDSIILETLKHMKLTFRQHTKTGIKQK